MKLLLTIPETCDALCLGRAWVYKLAADGALDARKAGKKILITRESVERYAASLPAAKLTPRRSAAVQNEAA
jgi:excisionase family DNA binding protein